MNRDNVRWYSFERDRVPLALMGNIDASPYGPSVSFGAPRPSNGKIIIGFCQSSEPSYYQPPSLIVMESETSGELFSWLKTYAPDTFPLSQFARVISAEDWVHFRLDELGSRKVYDREDSWAAIVLGELLAQGDSDADLNSVPFSRAAACFSITAAKTLLTHGSEEAFSTCVSRLKKLEADARFVRRPVSIEDLHRIWNILIGEQHNIRNDSNIVASLINIIEVIFSSRNMNSRYAIPILNDYPGLMSDSAEDRVMAYQQVLSSLANSKGNPGTDFIANATIAAAAFLVGRSTSHIFLLRRASKMFPSASIWFALIAAMAGPKSWDSGWIRATKGIEKFLRTNFDWKDPSLSDICWQEYAWLSRVFDGVGIFDSLSKITPRVLSVEVLPGAACQLRLANSQADLTEQERKGPNEIGISVREKELEATLSQIVNLAIKTKELLPNKKNERQEQPSLFRNDPVLSSKAPRKKTRGGSGFEK